jgi:cation diffusion facilitator family transporter
MQNAAVQDRYQTIRSILIAILLLNWGVAIAKITYGYITHFSSMTADGFHSLADGTSNIICLIGIHFARQPTDKDHPYGHRKYETLFSLAIGALLFGLCFNLLREGFARLKNPQTAQIDPVSFIVMLSTLAVNFWVMRYEYGKGKLLHSDLLISDSLHTKADIFTSLSVIAALIVTKAGFPLIDPIVTLMIACFIAYAGFEILKEGSQVLCDSAVISDVKSIEAIVCAIPEVRACHNIRTRGRSDDIHIDLHVQVKADMHMDKAHRISETIEQELLSKVPGATDVVVHMEPVE